MIHSVLGVRVVPNEAIISVLTDSFGFSQNNFGKKLRFSPRPPENWPPSFSLFLGKKHNFRYKGEEDRAGRTARAVPPLASALD